jgi:hypothetical protein
MPLQLCFVEQMDESEKSQARPEAREQQTDPFGEALFNADTLKTRMNYDMYHDSYTALFLNTIKSPKGLVSILTVSAAVAAWWLRGPTKKPKRQVQDEVVMIIGASSGVGLETARLYAKSWDTHPNRMIHLVARRTEIRDIQEEIERSTGCKRVAAHVANAGSEDSMRRLAEVMQILSGSGRIDTLIFW